MEGNNILEITSADRVTRLEHHNINDLLTSNITARFPNLRRIHGIDVPIHDYADSIEMIKIAIRSTDSLEITIIGGIKEELLDILKYIQLLDNGVVKNRLIVSLQSELEPAKVAFTATKRGDMISFHPGTILPVEYGLDVSYLDNDKIGIGITGTTRRIHLDNTVKGSNIHKAFIPFFLLLRDVHIPDGIDTLYLSEFTDNVNINILQNTIYPKIKHIYLPFTDTGISYLKRKFPNAEFHFV